MERTAQSSKQRQKDSNGEKNMPRIDRLSALPDGVLRHILSFLPTKCSIKTSILARRWRFLWAHVPLLDFDSESHFSETSCSHFINRAMLLHRAQCVNYFYLFHVDDLSQDELETWITSVIARRVQNIDLRLKYQVRLPECLFTCKTLVDLSLDHCVGIPSSGVVWLPSLKKLYLKKIKYEDVKTLPHLLSGCPVLEELFINRIEDANEGCYNISSPSLKWLKIKFPFLSWGFDKPDYKVKINAPALRNLEISDCSYEHLSLSPTTSLIEADIWLNNYSLESVPYLYSHWVLKFFNSLCNVECMRLSGCYDESLDLGVVGPVVKFDKLRRLEFAAEWCLLKYFLENADHLEVLIIRQGLLYNEQKKWMEPMEDRRACLLYSLRIVTFEQFQCREEEFKMVKYILRNARVLKRMEIHFQCIRLEEISCACRIISLYHRGSKCEVAFYWD